MRRNTAERRHLDRIKALRKRKIVCLTWIDGSEFADSKPLHYFSKAKVHCSCPLCRAKTKYNGYTVSDQRKIDAGNYGLAEF